MFILCFFSSHPVYQFRPSSAQKVSLCSSYCFLATSEVFQSPAARWIKLMEIDALGSVRWSNKPHVLLRHLPLIPSIGHERLTFKLGLAVKGHNHLQSDQTRFTLESPNNPSLSHCAEAWLDLIRRISFIAVHYEDPAIRLLNLLPEQWNFPIPTINRIICIIIISKLIMSHVLRPAVLWDQLTCLPLSVVMSGELPVIYTFSRCFDFAWIRRAH